MIPDGVLGSLEPTLRAKSQALFSLLHDMGSLVVAFSGGVDSSLVCAVGMHTLGERMLAVYVRSPVDTTEDHAAAEALARQVGFACRVIDFDDLANPQFVANPPDRCYHCKLARFRAVQGIAAEFGAAWIAEGSNADDASDYRPGSRAVAELGVRSPLAEVGMTKVEIRALSKALGLPVWNKPSAPCLATRFPYGTPVTRQGLRQVARGEAYLQGLGFHPVRVRYFGQTARLEVSPEAVPDLAARREEVLSHFRELGFANVVVDLAGYRSGSMNEGLKR